ncbi:hypothetical protein OH77DRAFT_1463605 [Trametes cingulata]|nr:hypothetical protein OH77DRAFT_1463605 [Trametes cingulata]
MRLLTQSQHHPRGRRGHYPRSPPVMFWDSYMTGNPSGIFVDPDGEVITSGEDLPGASGNSAVPDGTAQSHPSTGEAASSNPLADVSKGQQLSSTPATTGMTKPSDTVSASNTISASVASRTVDAVSTTNSANTETSQAESQLSSAQTSITAASAFTSGLSLSASDTTISANTATSENTATTSPDTATFADTTSSANTATSASTSPTARVNSASQSNASDRTTSFYIGIAFAAIAGVGLIVAILTWWLRIRRSRSRRRKLSRMTTWPWDHDRFGGRQLSLEGGLGIHGLGGEMLQRSRLGSPISSGRDDLANTPAHLFPDPPPPVHTQGGSPYVTIPLHGAHQSVPDLTPDLGNLQITNLMPGDLSSGGESSRASTALGMQHTYPAEYGTPFMPHRPCFLGVENGGLDVPWAPLRVRRSGTVSAQTPEAQTAFETVKLEEPLPYPGDISVAADVHPPARLPDDRQASWAASIRSNILNAFNAVVGANPSQVSTSRDTFTPVPHRTSQRSRKTAARGPRENASNVSRSSTTASTASATGWTLEETGNGAGVVHIRNRSGSSDSAPAQDPFADNVQLPPPAVIAPRDRRSGFLCVSPPAPLTRASSMYSTASPEAPIPRVCDEPPRLPSIESLSRSPGTSADGSEAVQARDNVPRPRGRTNRRRKTAKQRRPTLLARKSSSQNSATSVGSEMSRASSACSELTDGERFAKHALRERRRRVMEMTVGRGKTKRSRATTLSRRRSLERTIRKRE